MANKKSEVNEQPSPETEASAQQQPDTLPVDSVDNSQISPTPTEDNWYRNISTTVHTIGPEGTPFNPGDIAQLQPLDIERLARAGHIFKVRPKKGGKK